MKSALLLIAVSYVIGAAYSIVCPPNYCATMTCQEITSCDSKAELRPNATFCGCCSACIIMLEENQSCLMLSGKPPTAICREPLRCIKGICK